MSRPVPKTPMSAAIMSSQDMLRPEVVSPVPVFGGPIAAPAPPPRGVAVGAGVLGTAVFGAGVAGAEVTVATEVADAVGVAVCATGTALLQPVYQGRFSPPSESAVSAPPRSVPRLTFAP